MSTRAMLTLRALTSRLSLTQTQPSALLSPFSLSHVRFLQTDKSADGDKTQKVLATDSTTTQPQTVATENSTKSPATSTDDVQQEVKPRKMTKGEKLVEQLKALAMERGPNVLAINPSLSPAPLTKVAIKKMKKTVPEMKPPIESHTHFLKLMGRNCESHAAHFKDWNHLFTSTGVDMKALGIPIPARKMILNFTQKYREHGVEPYYIHKPDKKVVKARTRRRLLKKKFMQRNNLIKKKPLVLTDGSRIAIFNESLNAKYGKPDRSLLE